jgi:transcriptional regulator with XRE-family HTH domain
MKENERMTIKTVLNNIQRLRTQKGLSVQYVADKLCISPKAFRGMENGYRAISLDQFFHLAEILGVQVSNLISEDMRVDLNHLRRVS